MHATTQYACPTLIGTTNLAPHNLRFGIFSIKGRETNGVGETFATSLRFFNERLPNEMDGKVGECYADIVEHSLNKALLCMGHSMRCVSQKHRITTLLDKSTGDTITVIIDYMMKWEEQRACESSRDHYGKRGVPAHGGLIKYKLPNGRIFKRVCMTTPEGDATKYAKAALSMIDLICRIMTEEEELKEVKK